MLIHTCSVIMPIKAQGPIMSQTLISGQTDVSPGLRPLRCPWCLCVGFVVCPSVGTRTSSSCRDNKLPYSASKRESMCSMSCCIRVSTLPMILSSAAKMLVVMELYTDRHPGHPQSEHLIEKKICIYVNIITWYSFVLLYCNIFAMCFEDLY